MFGVVLTEVTICVIPVAFEAVVSMLLLMVEEFPEVAETNEDDDIADVDATLLA